ncbi:MAG: trypsin-like peptidase domain-containing protein [Myxococcales bacterium]
MLCRLLAAFAALALLAPVPALAKSEKSRVVQKALLQSVRVEVTTSGKVVRAATGVVVASEEGKSFILTNEHVVSRDGLKGTPSYTVVIERPALRRVTAYVRFEGEVPAEDLAILEVSEVLPVVPVAPPLDVQVGDDVVVIGAPYGRSLSVSSGIVSQLEIVDADPRQQRSMKTDAPIGYGASGGGVFGIPGGKLVGLVEGYRTAKVSFGGVAGSDYSFDVPMPGETFLSPPAKIRAFLVRAGIGRLAGIHDSPWSDPTGPGTVAGGLAHERVASIPTP